MREHSFPGFFSCASMAFRCLSVDRRQGWIAVGAIVVLGGDCFWGDDGCEQIMGVDHGDDQMVFALRRVGCIGSISPCLAVGQGAKPGNLTMVDGDRSV